MERAGAAMLLPSVHPIQSFINDGIDFCVWLQIQFQWLGQLVVDFYSYFLASTFPASFHPVLAAR